MKVGDIPDFTPVLGARAFQFGEESGFFSPLLLLGDGASEPAHGLLSCLILGGQRAVVADGANCFDAYRLARAARSVRRPIPTLLSAVRISRAFTWQQFLSLLETEIAAEAARTGSRWVFVLGPLDLLADHELKPFPALRVARRVAEALDGIARMGLGVIAMQSEGPLRRAGRETLLSPLKRACRNTIEFRQPAERLEAAGRDRLRSITGSPAQLDLPLPGKA